MTPPTTVPVGKIRLIGMEPDGSVYTSHWVWSLLFGVDVCDVDRFMETVDFKRDGAECLPAEWRRAGMRRGREAMAGDNVDAFDGVLNYWTRKVYGRAVIFESPTEVWMTEGGG